MTLDLPTLSAGGIVGLVIACIVGFFALRSHLYELVKDERDEWRSRASHLEDELDKANVRIDDLAKRPDMTALHALVTDSHTQLAVVLERLADRIEESVSRHDLMMERHDELMREHWKLAPYVIDIAEREKVRRGQKRSTDS